MRKFYLRRVLQINGIDRLVLQCVDLCDRFCQFSDRAQQLGGDHRRCGADGVAEYFGALRGDDLDAVFERTQFFHAARDVYLAAVPFDEICGALREQRGEVDARQQHVAVFARLGQRVAQHVEQHLRRGLVDRRVQRGDAQRFPELLHQRGILLVLREQFGDGDIVG